MSPNRRKLKHRIKPPKRYEGSVSAISKKNDNDQNTSNDANSKDDMKNKGMSVVEVSFDQNRLETREIDKVLDRESVEKEQVMNEVIVNLNVNANTNSIIDNNEKYIIDENVSNEATNSDANGGKPRTYANMVKQEELLVNKNQIFIAPKVTEDGGVKVLFDEEIVSKGCAKWMFTICGHLIGVEYGSALASNLGKPKIMDAHMCQFGMGMTDYARVLVEIKEDKDVLGYCLGKCTKRPRTREEMKAKLKEQEDQDKNIEDVYENEEGIAQTMTTDNVRVPTIRITTGWPWMITGDSNVTLNNEEHSNGGSIISSDTQDFIDYVNDAEMEDLCSNDVFYTWIKSPLKP
ncbi:hypothetical protein Tco_1186667 [Tanacetum coccineum]